MVQGTKQLKKRVNEKGDKRHRQKEAERKQRVGLDKVAKKPTAGKGGPAATKMNKKLVSNAPCSSHRRSTQPRNATPHKMVL
jgi:hypothetical protein